MGGVETELETGDGGDAVGSCWLLLGHQQLRRRMKVVALVECSMGEVLEIHSPGWKGDETVLAVVVAARGLVSMRGTRGGVH